MDAEHPPTSNTMDSSSFSQVVFNNVEKSYFPGQSVKCAYTIMAVLKPNIKDWVGIFKVGWSTTRDYYTFLWAPLPSDLEKEEQAEQEVVFEVYYLPKEDGEFYQFCYVDSRGLVRGASTPFRFQGGHESSLEADLLVVTTQEQVDEIEKEAEELRRENRQQGETIVLLKRELEDRLLELRKTRESVEKLGSEVSKLQVEGEEERQGREAVFAQLGKLETTLAGTEEQSLESFREKEELQQTLTALRDRQDKVVAKARQLRAENEELKKRSSQAEEEIDTLRESLTELQRGKTQAESELKKLQDWSQLLQFDLGNAQRENVKLAGELRNARGAAESVQVLRSENQELRRALEGKKENTEIQAQCRELELKLQEARALASSETQRAGRTLQEVTSVRHAHEREGAERQEREAQLQYWKHEFEIMKDRLEKTEMLLTESRRGLEEEAVRCGIQQLEIEELRQANKDLQMEMQRLRRAGQTQHSPLSSLPDTPAVQLQHPNPYSLPPVPSIPPHTPSLLYPNPFIGTTGQSGSVTQGSVKDCPVCRVQFPGITDEELAQHMESHERICPFCGDLFEYFTQEEFESHVYAHDY
ncbi:calcium-binding and coiled-coil domain-containing protein 2 isoform X1 [Acipenser ruthenus]|uniref:calcium-binding and coiled-coil domain-containing protein 2 isoform X1 n=1 Tax=Acipenser ruthenus TaxID=7906 RepID=UPI0027426AC0|nr:calcium-binding and coiled-coil domain-containing protein 2 isoform X1 [Acipenser ruthenus]XP_033911746.3 calcium-binding and coiled-coil domain-containing protein 2 isoform X1 [Acipenser ruthenus]XP_033911748.3 calcium-binding and coiled-coil domain-containing protein 2 isoform X1 [Acipenser ruthenus]XP_058862641.1 calcium-binding and coiled-coil domain-containing protein 2 isoform X1 [Acipenser ruthenus]XP_058862642.1 calcium-binding and coiled-coil domain-containing protein 2 isoform X1 [